VTDDSLRARIERWLESEMQIVQNHGGTSAVREFDRETGEVVVELGGTCSGCGISDVTAKNIEGGLREAVEGVESVSVKVPSTGEVGSSTVEGGRGGDLQYGTDHPEHL
jgi:Fe/S biogenesis protein NfuA